MTRKAIGKQLGYLRRNLNAIEQKLSLGKALTARQLERLNTIRTIYEQQKYIVNTNHQIQPLFLSMNLDFYNNLPDDLKTIVDAGCEEYVNAARAYSEQMLETYKQTMTDAGCTFIDVEPDDFADMYEATASVRASLAEQYPEFSAVLNDAITRTQG